MKLLFHLKKKMKKIQKNIVNNIVYFDNLKIVQNKEYFSFSLESVLLPNFAIVNENTKHILDLCTGNAPIPILLAQKTKNKIIGVELQKNIYDLAKESVKINNINNIELLNIDAKKLTELFETDTFDLITCNPPYFIYNKDSIINENEIKSIARHEIMINLEDIFKISKKLLKNGASLCLVHKTDRLIDIIELMRKYNIEPKRIQLIYPKKDADSNLVMIDGRKNGKTGLKLLKPMIVHNADGTYTEDILKIFGK